MFKQLFAVMNEVLDQIVADYPAADAFSKSQLEEQLRVLKEMSEICIEEWLLFEEKLRNAEPTATSTKQEMVPQEMVPNEIMSPKESQSENFSKGLGYFQLYMFDQAILEFEQVLFSHPDSLMARLYLALSYFQIGNYTEAYRHFQFIIPLSEDDKVKSASYNAMGCIQMKKKNPEKACEYFQLAYELDPTSTAPLANIGVCLNNEGSLEINSGFM